MTNEQTYIPGKKYDPQEMLRNLNRDMRADTIQILEQLARNAEGWAQLSLSPEKERLVRLSEDYKARAQKLREEYRLK
jgi:hypothetical protein